MEYELVMTDVENTVRTNQVQVSRAVYIGYQPLMKSPADN